MNDQTQVMGVPTTMGGNQTQMGGSVTCSGCGTNNPSMELYCNECGLKLDIVLDASQPLTNDEAPAYLVDGTGVRRSLKQGINTIGRIEADVLIPDETVSRLHARITVENDTVVLEDIGSTNGSRVDDVRLSPGEPTELHNGNTIRFGNWKGKIEITPSEPVAAADRTVMEVPDFEVDEPSEEIVETVEPLADLIAEKAELSNINISIGLTTLGRRDSNSVVLKHDAYISGLHAELSCSAAEFTLVDLGSTNGTFVNKVKLEAHKLQELQNGDLVQLGQTSYTLKVRPLESTQPKVEEELS